MTLSNLDTPPLRAPLASLPSSPVNTSSDAFGSDRTGLRHVGRQGPSAVSSRRSSHDNAGGRRGARSERQRQKKSFVRYPYRAPTTSPGSVVGVGARGVEYHLQWIWLEP